MLAHSIAEYDDFRMLTAMGHDVFSIGAYTNPRKPGDDKRPAVHVGRHHPELEALVPDQMKAKEHLPAELIEWADVIICHHYLREWIFKQWGRIRHKRVIWRTCGQSDPPLEDLMAPLRRDGLTIVRYSPAEERFFKPTGHWAGADAVIRFGKYPEDWDGWMGTGTWVANITQNMADRGEWCGLGWYKEATHELRARPAGPGSEKLPGGRGALDYADMRRYLRQSRAYAYTGTMPASYTLGLIEALMTGVPVVSIGPAAWMGPDSLFEAHELCEFWADEPAKANARLRDLLGDYDYALSVSDRQRRRAVELFDVEPIKAQWAAVLA